MHYPEILYVAESIEKDIRLAVKQGVLPKVGYAVRAGTNWHICTLEIDRLKAHDRADPDTRHILASIVYKRLAGDDTNVWLSIDYTLERIRP